MVVTIRLKDKKVLVCDALENFDFVLNKEKEELEVYKNQEFLGYFSAIYGTTEEDLFEYITNTWEQNSKEED